MGLGARKAAAPEGDNNIFWTTMSDLMLGLACHDRFFSTVRKTKSSTN